MLTDPHPVFCALVDAAEAWATGGGDRLAREFVAKYPASRSELFAFARAIERGTLVKGPEGRYKPVKNPRGVGTL
jgi:hypothetical protein